MARKARQHRGRAGLAIGLAAIALWLAPVARGAAGDVYVVDEEFGSGSGAVLQLPAAGGAIADSFTSSLFFNPSGMAFDARGRLIVADYTANRLDVVIPATGAVTSLAGPPTVGAPNDVALGPDGLLYAVEQLGPAIVRVNPRTGAAAGIASGSAPWDGAGGIVVARNRTIYFTDQDDEVFRLLPGASTATVLVEDPALAGAEGILLSPDERYLFVAAASGGTQHIVRIDLRNNNTFTNFAALDTINSMAMLPDGGFLTTDPGAPEKISRVTPDGITVTDFSTDAGFSYPHDIVVQPRRCGGRFPTLVGTTGRDVLRGSRFADVISTLGGRDVVRGLKGNDVVCGGKGRDRLLGGAGRDRLLGGAGRDVLRGGPGRDQSKQ